jgi:hypothetical protein
VFPCPSCAALRAIVARVDDVEEMAKRFNLTIAFTDNLCKWLKEGKRWTCWI